MAELDESQHADEVRWRAEERRTDCLHDQSYRVLRFWNEEIFDHRDPPDRVHHTTSCANSQWLRRTLHLCPANYSRFRELEPIA
ncbi:MAG: DUF559 domain-containing protein [Deltaproteobacteria bacterium]|nr:DUF559 domain-containing protein [Deltaproteobacteria bacterium]